jgi:hypothetical protein
MRAGRLVELGACGSSGSGPCPAVGSDTPAAKILVAGTEPACTIDQNRRTGHRGSIAHPNVRPGQAGGDASVSRRIIAEGSPGQGAAVQPRSRSMSIAW